MSRAAVLEVEMPPDPSAMSMVRLVLRRCLPDLETDEASLYYGAVTEILANAVDAHRAVGAEDPVVIELRTGDRPSVTVIDAGPGFSPEDAVPPESDGRGRGLLIARSVCPDLTISTGPDGTTVVLPVPVGPPQLVERVGERSDDDGR